MVLADSVALAQQEN